MAFLDNSGDIILDAVLTDTGRLRLAQGDGSFKISKFALGDDEINYGNYNKSHSSGSAYYDLEVLQTPVLEAFTNNTSNLKTKLVTMSRTNVLYMPILKLNNNNTVLGSHQEKESGTFSRQATTVAGNSEAQGGFGGELILGDANVSDNRHYVAVDAYTYDVLKIFKRGTTRVNGGSSSPNGVIQGFDPSSSGVGDDQTPAATDGGSIIRVDHGLNTTEVSPGIGLDSDLMETAFIVEMDYRLGRLKSPLTTATTPVNFIDDDNIATYYVSTNYVNPGAQGSAPHETNSVVNPSISSLSLSNPQVFEGPRGNTLQFRIKASQELRQSTYLFTQLGSSQSATVASNILGLPTDTTDDRATNRTIYYLDTTVRVVGANTGYQLDIPVRYIKVA
jgi:hypothetical protein